MFTIHGMIFVCSLATMTQYSGTAGPPPPHTVTPPAGAGENNS